MWSTNRLLVGARRCKRGLQSHNLRCDGRGVSIEPLALEGAVVELIQGGEEEGAAGELASKRKRGVELAHQPVRHSLWEQGSLEAHNELLFGCLDGEVEALQQRKGCVRRGKEVV